jgi:hypothetical protein
LLHPGQGYKISLKQNDQLIYPSNTQFVNSYSITGSETVFDESTSQDKVYPDISGTGSNMIVLIESPELNEGDEVGAWTSATKKLVGNGVAQSKKCIVVIWGKDPLVDNSTGAEANEEIFLTVWQKSLGRESKLPITSLKNAVTGSKESTSLRYTNESIKIAAAKPVPVTHYLEQNFPNPFNSSTTILFGISATSRVNLGIYNSLGQHVAQLAAGTYSPGQYRVTLRSARLASGMYICRMQAGTFVRTMKMMLLK